MRVNLGIRIPLRLLRIQCVRLFDVAYYKNITMIMSQEKTTEGLLEIYQKNRDSMNEINHTYFLNKVIKTSVYHGKTPLNAMGDSLNYLYEKL